MPASYYETHHMPNPLLPFIFHKDRIIHHPVSLQQWHENIEILYCISGEGTVLYDQEEIPFRKGDIFLVNSNTLHATNCRDSFSYYCLIIDTSFWESNGIPISNLYFESRIRDSVCAGLYQEIVNCYENLSKNRDYAVAELRFSVLRLMLHLCRFHCCPEKKPADGPSVTNQRITRALVYIRNHLADPMTLDEIADHVGVSKFYLSREFKSVTGSTVVDMINLIRCAEARRLIQDGMKVSAAAASCGYRNLSYFSKTFKHLYQQTPTAFSPGASGETVSGL